MHCNARNCPKEAAEKQNFCEDHKHFQTIYSHNRPPSVTWRPDRPTPFHYEPVKDNFPERSIEKTILIILIVTYMAVMLILTALITIASFTQH